MLGYLNEPLLEYRYNQNDERAIRLDFNLSTREELIRDYFIKGFAIYEVDSEIDETIIWKISKYLELNEPYTPPIYKNTSLYKNGVNQLTPSEGSHRAFQTNNAQDLHCDGTIEEIGLMKTTILHCVKAASIGGETTIFNSSGAFHHLYKSQENRHTLELLLKDDTLKRVATNLDFQEYVGPVFQVQNNKLVSRFSRDNTSYWQETFEKNKETEKAFWLINNLAVEGSPFFLKFKLKDNQGIILANDRIAHGRTTFIDENRKMYRGLFKKRIY